MSEGEPMEIKFHERLDLCPRCGAPGEITGIGQGANDPDACYFAHCSDEDDCSLQLITPFDSEEDARKAWNTRRPISTEDVREAAQEAVIMEDHLRDGLRALGIEVEGDAD